VCQHGRKRRSSKDRQVAKWRGLKGILGKRLVGVMVQGLGVGKETVGVRVLGFRGWGKDLLGLGFRRV
jgi:hypothetical protein